MTIDLKLFKKLLNTPSPSGFEEAARAVWREAVRPSCDEMRTDAQGSEIATIQGRSPETSLLLMGHIDEIGLLVRYVDDEGFLFVTPIGGIDPGTLISQRVRLLGPAGIVEGVIGKIAVHLQSAEERKKQTVEMHELWVDIGAASRAEADALAPVGTPAVVGDDVTELRGGRWAARDVDNKMGAFVVAEVMRRLWKKKSSLGPTIYGAATTQEETGVWGAGQVAYGLNPTAAIAIDVGHALDIPGANHRRHGKTTLGGGPIVTVGVRSNNRLTAGLREAAKKASIPVQIDTETGRHMTDADPASATRTGIPSASVGIPLRYMHTSVEVTALADIEALVELLTAYILGLKPPLDFTP